LARNFWPGDYGFRLRRANVEYLSWQYDKMAERDRSVILAAMSSSNATPLQHLPAWCLQASLLGLHSL